MGSRTGNGLNCGRWVQVTIGNYCTGVNDGAPNEPFCRNGSWVSDSYNGAALDMVVADSCEDGNAWCRDDPYYVDLAQASLNTFVRSGQPVGDMYPSHWNNRQVSWQFIPAPNYSGDINIGAIQGAQPYWPAIAISHLPNGIHGVQYYAGGTWHGAQMDADMGDDYIIAPTMGQGTGGTQFEIRVLDATDTLINDGRVHSFSLPAGCATGCGPAYTPISYTTSTGPPPPPPPPPNGCCSAAFSVTNSWSGGYQAQVTVTNNGTAPTTGWSTSFSLSSGQTITRSWNAVVSQTRQQVSASSQTYNAAVAAGASATWGLVINTGSGQAQPPSSVTCTTS